MKKQDIRNIYTQKVTELLNQGYTILPDTMGGSQGEIAHIDLSNGSEILRAVLSRDYHWERDEGGYLGETIRLTVGKAGEDTRVYDNWDGTIWNNRLEPRFEIEWAWLTHNRRNSDWYTSIDEGRRITQIRKERYMAKQPAREAELGDAYKSIALTWLRKQPRMKTCRLEDITKLERSRDRKGRLRYTLTAKGRQYTIR